MEQEKKQKSSYKQEIRKVIMGLPKNPIRKFPYLTTIDNPQHISAYENISYLFDKREKEIREEEKRNYETEVSQLKQQNQELKQKNQELTEENKGYQRKVAGLEKTNQDYKSRLEKIAQQIPEDIK